MIIYNRNYSLNISDKSGSLQSFSNGVREFIAEGGEDRSLFTIRFRNDQGEPVDLGAQNAESFIIEKEANEQGIKLKMVYKCLGGLHVNVYVEVICPENEGVTYWNLSVDHDTEYYIDWVDFPDVVVPNDLTAAGGKAKILWPAMEGVIIENVDLRDKNGFKYSSVGYPSKGWEGLYPGPCTTQFMAYYDDNGGLYFGAHDEETNVKAIEYYRHDDGVRLEFRLFPGGTVKGTYKMKYNMVLGMFYGDWHDAAEIYRKWYTNCRMEKPPRLIENSSIPEWLKQSPVVAVYPVRGQMHMGDMTTNDDYYPFTNALLHINTLSEKLVSKVLALPMQWEGTAPWAPPYVWPPLGGEENFRRFVEGLHEEGNLAGLYCSGIAWTNESVLVPEYVRKSQYEEQKLENIMCKAPEGDLPNSLICNGPIRWGYDMCPTNQFVEDVAAEEVSKIANSGCDYIQYFDQNLGGTSYFCYAKDHGHPPAPGRWQEEAMIKIFKKLLELDSVKDGKVLIGCEGAAAEPYMPYLAFNDLRFFINYSFGCPVPLYSYIYHEYVNNFMGNQCLITDVINTDKSPLNLNQRIAYSFCAGDMLAVALSDGGQIHWGWCTPWNKDKPDQETTTVLIRNLNAWRNGIGKSFLCYGKMEKPYELQGIYDIPINLNCGEVQHYPSLFTSRWISPDGRNAQIIVNYTLVAQDLSIKLNNIEERNVVLFDTPEGSGSRSTVSAGDKIDLKIRPLSALLLEVT